MRHLWQFNLPTGLLLKFIDMQNRHFGLGHERAMGERFAAYNAISGRVAGQRQ